MSHDIPPGDRWGPWADRIDPAERKARTRCLRAIVTVILGERGSVLAHALLIAEALPEWLPLVLPCLDGLAALDRRRVLSAYGLVSCPRWRG